MTGVPAIHYPLGKVDPGPCGVSPFVYIEHAIDRSAVNPHAQWYVGLLLQSCRDLRRAFDRRFGIAEKDQRHSVAGRQTNEISLRVGRAHLRGAAHDLAQTPKQFRLRLDEQFGVADHVHRQHMANLHSGVGSAFG